MQKTKELKITLNYPKIIGALLIAALGYAAGTYTTKPQVDQIEKDLSKTIMNREFALPNSESVHYLKFHPGIEVRIQHDTLWTVGDNPQPHDIYTGVYVIPRKIKTPINHESDTLR